MNPTTHTDTYHAMLRHILTHGTKHEDRTGVGTTRVFGYQARFNLTEGFPLITTKKLPFRWIAEELLWMLRGSTNEKDLRAQGVDIWKEWATKEKCAEFGRIEGDLGPVYGHQFRNYGATVEPRPSVCIPEPPMRWRPDGVDQVVECLRTLRSNPGSRRNIINLWNPLEATKVTLPPCHVLTQFVVMDGRLSAQLYQRSADAFLGVPFNIASYALLIRIFAALAGLESGELVHTFGDLHIYANHEEQVREQLSRDPRHNPMLGVTQIETLHPKASAHDIRTTIQHLSVGNFGLAEYDPHPKLSAPVAV